MAKELQFQKLNSSNNIKKQNSQFCFNSFGFFDCNQFVKDNYKCDENKESHQDQMKKSYEIKNEHKGTASSTYQSQKILSSKLENFSHNINLKLNINKPKEKENNVFRQPKTSETDVSNNQIGKEKSLYKSPKSKDQDKQQNFQNKVLSINNTLIDRRTSDPNILMPLSSLVRKSQKQKIQPQFQQNGSTAQNQKDQITDKDFYKQKSQSQQEVLRYGQDEKEVTLVQKEEIIKEIKQLSSQCTIKKCSISLAQEHEEVQQTKNKSQNNNKNLDLQILQVQKSNRAHTQGKQEQIKINRLYEYILEGNY